MGRRSRLGFGGGTHIELALVRGIIQRITYVVALACHAGRRGRDATTQVGKE
jgi:hypothetical protein